MKILLSFHQFFAGVAAKALRNGVGGRVCENIFVTLDNQQRHLLSVYKAMKRYNLSTEIKA